MSTFTQYLAESTKSYDYKIKIVGASNDIDKNALESALQKFDLASMSAGKTTPFRTKPLDFPALSNEQVTIFDVTTNYPTTSREMKEYLSDILRIPHTHIVVRKPNEPTEEYQDQMEVAKKSEYANKLHDIEYAGSSATTKRVYRNKAITDIRKLITEGYVKIDRTTQDVSVAIEKAAL